MTGLNFKDPLSGCSVETDRKNSVEFRSFKSLREKPCGLNVQAYTLF